MAIPAPQEMIRRLRLLPAAQVLLDRLDPGRPVYLVGGAVRDLLLGQLPPDLDLMVDGDVRALARDLDAGVLIHDRFGTATFRIDGFVFDVARTRRERYPHPGSLPEVEPARLEEDLLRRDFTVNAIAMALGEPQPGSITAAPRALGDLSDRVLRVLHDGSFTDDPTRLLRLARYESRLGFEVEEHTGRLAAEAVARGALATVSGPRVGAELRLLAREPDPVAALAALERLGLAKAIHVALGLTDVQQAQRALAILGPHGRRDLLVLGLASQGIRAGELGPLLDRLSFEAPERRKIVAVATGPGALSAALSRAGSPSEIAAAVGEAPPELVAAAGARTSEEQARQWLNELRAVRLEIDGADLLAAGIPEGPAIGRGLRAALSAKLDGRAHGPQEELARALRAAKESQ